MQTYSGFIQTNDITIHYERTGGEKHPFVLCHGITDNGRCMLRLAEYLAPHYDVIMVDARGHGLSDAPEDGYSSDHHADDLYGLIMGLGLDNPIIYGHSMGARTTIRLAAKYPNLPRSIILEDPVYIIPLSKTEKAARKLWLQQLPIEIQYRKTLTEVELIKIAKEQNHPDWTEAEEIEWARAKTQVSPKVAKVGHTMMSIIDDFPHISCNVLILKAEADKETRRKNKESITKIPQGKIIHIKGAGHNIRRDNWEETIQNLDGFLAKI